MCGDYTEDAICSFSGLEFFSVLISLELPEKDGVKEKKTLTT